MKIPPSIIAVPFAVVLTYSSIAVLCLTAFHFGLPWWCALIPVYLLFVKKIRLKIQVFFWKMILFTMFCCAWLNWKIRLTCLKLKYRYVLWCENKNKG